jgi:UDP-N-acetylmuramoyl-tripeptide--D-alanyl-D-alanine ligase
LTIENLYKLYLQNPQVQTDTRKLEKGDIFFALSGPDFNGNQFAEKALELGASYAIVDEPVSDNEKIILVDDVLTTLQNLAKHHREQFQIPFIAITGSNGKTTTKELVYAVLSSHHNTSTTQGNLNNHIGIPLTLLRIKKDAEVAVIEMGANHQKEIEGYCQYVQPTHAVITNCGKAHLEGFGGIEGVRKGKGELFDFIRKNDGTAFVFHDMPYLNEMSQGIHKIITYGTQQADITGTAVSTNSFLNVQITHPESLVIQTNLVGDYNLPNVLCAVAIGNYFKVPKEKMKQALENYTPDNSRSQMLNYGSSKIILDAYNANPTSMKAAIENMEKIKAENKILVLGSMMEMGDASPREHQALVDQIKANTWKHVVLVGNEFSKIHHSFSWFKNVSEAAEWFSQQNFSNAVILVKGSRSQQMEKILQAKS